MQATSNLFARDRRNTTEKRERKTKNGKKSNYSKKFFFTFTFSYKKNNILLENIFGKTYIVTYVLQFFYKCITVF